jgi:hypothetical protein
VRSGYQFAKRRFRGFVPIEITRPCRPFDHAASSEILVPGNRFESIPHRLGGSGIEYQRNSIGNFAERWNRRTGARNSRRQCFH